MESSYALSQIKVHIIQAKLQPDALADLVSLIEDISPPRSLRLALCADPKQADVVVTAVRMRQRLERHLDWELAVCLPSASILRRNVLRLSFRNSSQ